MKRIVTLLSALAVACALSVPAFAKKASKGKKQETSTSMTSKKKSHHWLHAKKKGSKEGKKKGQ
jgi:acid phosphatase class B